MTRSSTLANHPVVGEGSQITIGEAGKRLFGLLGTGFVIVMLVWSIASGDFWRLQVSLWSFFFSGSDPAVECVNQGGAYVDHGPNLVGPGWSCVFPSEMLPQAS